MSDTLPPLPERLRTYSADPELSDRYSDAMQEAADEIERLQAGIRELVAASGAETMGAAAVAEPVAWKRNAARWLRSLADKPPSGDYFSNGMFRSDCRDLAEQLEAPAAPPRREREPLTDDEIRAVFLAHGFTIKDGMTDLKPYVYAAARAIVRAAAEIGRSKE